MLGTLLPTKENLVYKTNNQDSIKLISPFFVDYSLTKLISSSSSKTIGINLFLSLTNHYHDFIQLFFAHFLCTLLTISTVNRLTIINFSVCTFVSHLPRAIHSSYLQECKLSNMSSFPSGE